MDWIRFIAPAFIGIVIGWLVFKVRLQQKQINGLALALAETERYLQGITGETGSEVASQLRAMSSITGIIYREVFPQINSIKDAYFETTRGRSLMRVRGKGWWQK